MFQFCSFGSGGERLSWSYGEAWLCGSSTQEDESVPSSCLFIFLIYFDRYVGDPFETSIIAIATFVCCCSLLISPDCK